MLRRAARHCNRVLCRFLTMQTNISHTATHELHDMLGQRSEQRIPKPIPVYMHPLLGSAPRRPSPRTGGGEGGWGGDARARAPVAPREGAELLVPHGTPLRKGDRVRWGNLEPDLSVTLGHTQSGSENQPTGTGACSDPVPHFQNGGRAPQLPGRTPTRRCQTAPQRTADRCGRAPPPQRHPPFDADPFIPRRRSGASNPGANFTTPVPSNGRMFPRDLVFAYPRRSTGAQDLGVFCFFLHPVAPALKKNIFPPPRGSTLWFTFPSGRCRAASTPQPKVGFRCPRNPDPRLPDAVPPGRPSPPPSIPQTVTLSLVTQSTTSWAWAAWAVDVSSVDPSQGRRSVASRVGMSSACFPLRR